MLRSCAATPSGVLPHYKHTQDQRNRLHTLTGDRLLARCLDGRVLVFHWPSLSLQAQWRVPGCSAAAGASHPSKPGLGATGDGRVVACGNARGQVLLFDAGSGGRISCCEPYRVEAGVVRGCAVSDDGRCAGEAAGAVLLLRLLTVPYTTAARGLLADCLPRPSLLTSTLAMVWLSLKLPQARAVDGRARIPLPLRMPVASRVRRQGSRRRQRRRSRRRRPAAVAGQLGASSRRRRRRGRRGISRRQSRRHAT